MATQIIMDHNGDTRHNFDTKDAKALSKAERRFKALTGVGFTAATRTASGEPVATQRVSVENDPSRILAAKSSVTRDTAIFR